MWEIERIHSLFLLNLCVNVQLYPNLRAQLIEAYLAPAQPMTFGFLIYKGIKNTGILAAPWSFYTITGMSPCIMFIINQILRLISL